MASDFGYRLSKRAQSDLDEMISYIAVELSNPQAAASFMKKLMKAIDEVCVFPESGPLVKNEFLADSNVRRKTVGSYIMYYLPDFTADTIYIVRIVYGRRNMDEILRKLDL